MKIYYIANIRLPNEKAHGLQIMKTCEALATLGHSVCLIIPKRKNIITTDPFAYYQVKPVFSLIFLPTVNILRLGRVGFWLQTVLFAELVAWKIRRDKPDVVYSRDELVLLNLFFIYHNLVWETHRGTLNWAIKFLLKKAKVVAITKSLALVYSNYVPNQAISIIPDAVDLSEFQINVSQIDCRARFNLPQDKKIALYAGHLYRWKGATILAEASKHFNSDECAVFVGGTAHDLILFKNQNNIEHGIIVGHVSHVDIPYYLKAADVLVLPNSSKNPLSSLYTSPMKLFEYMASERPIVASDVSSLREILDEKCALLVKPDSPVDLLNGLRTLFNNKKLGDDLARQAVSKVKSMTWENRAKKIEEFIANDNDISYGRSL